MNLIQTLEKEQVEKLAAERPVPQFQPGDTLRVSVKVVEGARERIQIYEGVCIARKNRGVNTSFTVRKLSYGEGVERVFPLYSRAIAGIEVVRRGDVRRAKLYYLRGRTGKSARIAEKTDGYSAKIAAAEAEAAAAAKAGGPKKKKKKSAEDKAEKAAKKAANKKEKAAKKQKKAAAKKAAKE